MSERGTLPRACLEVAWHKGIAAGGQRRRQPESSLSAAAAVVAAVEEEEERVRLEGLGAAMGDGTAKRSSCWYFCDAMGDAAAGDRLE